MKTKTYKTGAKAGQTRPVKVKKEKHYQKEINYILSCISSEGYEVPEAVTPEEKLRFLYDTFYSEYGWDIERSGEFTALVNWLQGLPTCCTIAFYNHDIIELAKTWGSLTEKSTEKQVDAILESYWRFMAMRILGLLREYKIRKV